MSNHNLISKLLEAESKKILYDYVKIESYTATESERKVEDFFQKLYGKCFLFQGASGKLRAVFFVRRRTFAECMLGYGSRQRKENGLYGPSLRYCRCGGL